MSAAIDILYMHKYSRFAASHTADQIIHPSKMTNISISIAVICKNWKGFHDALYTKHGIDPSSRISTSVPSI